MDVKIDGKTIYSGDIDKISDRDIENTLRIKQAQQAYIKFRKDKNLVKDRYARALFDKISDRIRIAKPIKLPPIVYGSYKQKGTPFWERNPGMKEDIDIMNDVITDIFDLKDKILSSQGNTKIDKSSLDVVSGVSHRAIDNMTTAELFTLRSFLKSSNRTIMENAYDDIQSAIKGIGIVLDTILQSDKISEDDWLKLNRIKDQLEQLDMNVRIDTAKAAKKGEDPSLINYFNEIGALIKEVADSIGIEVPEISKMKIGKQDDNRQKNNEMSVV